MSFKSLNNGKIKTLILIGNGAIENGSEPLKEALRQAKLLGFFSHNIDLVDPISSSSMLVVLQRTTFDNLILILKKQLSYSEEDILKCINGLYAFIYFRIILAEEYQKYGNLYIRDTILPFLNKYQAHKESSICVTTNWDETSYNHPEIYNKTIQLHGKSSVYSSLILPTETISERALQTVNLGEVKEQLIELSRQKKIDSSFIDTILKYYCIDEQQTLFIEENNFIHLFQKINTLVIIGLEFNDYDHELMSTISLHKGIHIEQVIIINKISVKDSEEAENEKIKKIDRVRGLLECSREKITYFDTEREWLNDIRVEGSSFGNKMTPQINL